MPIHISFRINLSTSTKNPFWNFDRNFFKSVCQFGENGHLYYAEAPKQDISICSGYIYPFKIYPFKIYPFDFFNQYFVIFII